MLLREILCYKRDGLEVGTPPTNICKSKRRCNYYILLEIERKGQFPLLEIKALIHTSRCALLLVIVAVTTAGTRANIGSPDAPLINHWKSLSRTGCVVSVTLRFVFLSHSFDIPKPSRRMTPRLSLLMSPTRFTPARAIVRLSSRSRMFKTVSTPTWPS